MKRFLTFVLFVILSTCFAVNPSQTKNWLKLSVGQPSGQSSTQPTAQPSMAPSMTHVNTSDTTSPSGQPSGQPVAQPTAQPSMAPSMTHVNTSDTTSPSGQPSGQPVAQPTAQPSMAPSMTHVNTSDTTSPSGQPSGQPSTQPTGQPNLAPSSGTESSMSPSGQPSGQPSAQPSAQPSVLSTTINPTAKPSDGATHVPTATTSSSPTQHPLRILPQHPTASPSSFPSQVPSLAANNGGGLPGQSSSSPTFADDFVITCTHDCGSSFTVFIAPIVFAVVIVVSIIGYFVFHSVFDSSYKRTQTSSDHGNSNDSFGVDILDEGNDFETVFLNGNSRQNSSRQSIHSEMEDEEVLNDIMQCISEVNKEDGLISFNDYNSKGSTSSTKNSFASPFVARTFNNMMKVKSMNVKSPIKKKKGYHNLQSDDDFMFDQSENNSTPTGDVEMSSAGVTSPHSDTRRTTQEQDDDEFFAAIDSFDSFTPTKTLNQNSPITFPSVAAVSSPGGGSGSGSDSTLSPMTNEKSNNPFDMSLHNDDFAV